VNVLVSVLSCYSTLCVAVGVSCHNSLSACSLVVYGGRVQAETKIVLITVLLRKDR